MKRTIAILLCLTILAQADTLIERPAQAQTPLLGALVVVCTAAGAWMIIRCYHTYETPKKRCLVLYKSTDGKASWNAVCTNVMVVAKDLQGAMAFPAFGDRMTDDSAFYRVAEIPMPPGYQVRFPVALNTFPFVYQ